MEQYPGQYDDEARRKVGEGLLAHLVDRGVVDPPTPEPDEVNPATPSFRAQFEQMKREREQSLAQLAMASMASALQPEQDTPSEPSFGVAAAERERDKQGRFK